MPRYFPAIPGIEDVKRCIKAIKEAMEIGLGYIGKKNPEGRFLDKWVTFRELEDYLLNSEAIASAVSFVINVTYGFNDPVDTVIVSDIITLTGSGLVTMTSESGVTDDLVQILGLSKGHTVYLMAATGHTITFQEGTYLKMPTPTWTLTGPRIATFDCIGGDICVMRSHEANRT